MNSRRRRLHDVRLLAPFIFQKEKGNSVETATNQRKLFPCNGERRLSLKTNRTRKNVETKNNGVRLLLNEQIAR